MPRLRVLLRRTLLALGGLLALAALAAAGVWIYLHPPVERTDGLVYGRRGDQALTFDRLRPARPNGAAVVVVVSGGWRSKRPGEFATWMAAPLLRRGYTVFAVCHVSQPRATVMEIAADLHRAVRFLRHHAAEHGVDPARFGITGGSAGGHLSLLLATRGGPGDPAAPDPVDRGSSRVQAVAIFFPITDLLNLGSSTENPGDGGPPRSYVRAFGPAGRDPARWREIGRDTSPIYHVTAALPPVLIHHGDADTLTPLEQSAWFQAAAARAGATVKIVVRHGGRHGWTTMPWDIFQFGAWFDRHLAPAAAP